MGKTKPIMEAVIWHNRFYEKVYDVGNTDLSDTCNRDAARQNWQT